jgi:hypothetical protein
MHEIRLMLSHLNLNFKDYYIGIFGGKGEISKVKPNYYLTKKNWWITTNTCIKQLKIQLKGTPKLDGVTV